MVGTGHTYSLACPDNLFPSLDRQSGQHGRLVGIGFHQVGSGLAAQGQRLSAGIQDHLTALALDNCDQVGIDGFRHSGRQTARQHPPVAGLGQRLDLIYESLQRFSRDSWPRLVSLEIMGMFLIDDADIGSGFARVPRQIRS